MSCKKVYVPVTHHEERTTFTCDAPGCASEFTDTFASEWLPLDWFAVGNINGTSHHFCSIACVARWAQTRATEEAATLA